LDNRDSDYSGIWGKSFNVFILFLTNFRTTLEKSIAIFGILIGVVGFYFVISSINSVISERLHKNATFTNHINSLMKLKKKKGISEELYRVAISSIFRKDYKRNINNFNDMLNKFPKSLKKELKYKMNIHIFKNFKFVQKLSKKIVNTLGKHIKKIHIKKGNINQETSFIIEIIPQKMFILWIRDL
jgi:hypothetical protein